MFRRCQWGIRCTTSVHSLVAAPVGVRGRCIIISRFAPTLWVGSESLWKRRLWLTGRPLFRSSDRLFARLKKWTYRHPPSTLSPFLLYLLFAHLGHDGSFQQAPSYPSSYTNGGRVQSNLLQLFMSGLRL